MVLKLPKLETDVQRSKKYVIQFGGMNKADSAREGELAECTNLSSDAQPYLIPRKRREVVTSFENPTAFFAHNGMCVVDGTEFKYKGADDTEFSVKMTVAEGEKQITQVGNIIIVMPDKLYYNEKTGDCGPMSGEINVPGWYNSGQWYYFSMTRNRLKIYSTTANNQGRVDFDGGIRFYRKFRVGDVITIGDYIDVFYGDTRYYCSTPITATIRSIDYYGSIEDGYAEATFDEDAFAALKTYAGGEIGTRYCNGKLSVTVKREVPDLEYICESGGRLWGVAANTIYASEYLKPLCFNKFEGLSGDSYYIDVITPGEFTGCAAFSTHICFFKENCIHKIYGTRPSNFNLVTMTAQGVQKGSYRSIININEIIYYKSDNGICAYSGGMPSLILSDCFGTERYCDAVAGTDNRKYYISMKNSKGVFELFVYDTQCGVFLREDESRLLGASIYDGEMYLMTGDGNLVKYEADGLRDGVEWSAELAEFNEVINEKKGYSRLMCRYDLSDGAYLRFEVSEDRGRFRTVKTVSESGCRVVSIPIPPNRCDSFRVRISGKGECKVMNIVREFVIGSEV